jgi:hypothetical protein
MRCLSVIFFSLRIALAIKFNGTVILRRNLYWAYCMTSESSLMSWRTWINPRVEVSARGGFPNACADLIVTSLHFHHFLVQLAIGVMGDISWIQQVDFASCIHVCEQIGY